MSLLNLPNNEGHHAVSEAALYQTPHCIRRRAVLTNLYREASRQLEGDELFEFLEVRVCGCHEVYYRKHLQQMTVCCHTMASSPDVSTSVYLIL